MNSRSVFAGVALLAMLAGTALWEIDRAPAPRVAAPQFSPEALYAAVFRDPEGNPKSLGPYRKRLLVLNFWAPWCGPCREEMPGFSRLQSRWGARNVQFVGITGDGADEVGRFLREVPTTYPLLLGGKEAESWAGRLGDVDAVLPFTVILAPGGRVVEQKVGIYSESDMDKALDKLRGEMTTK